MHLHKMIFEMPHLKSDIYTQTNHQPQQGNQTPSFLSRNGTTHRIVGSQMQ